MQFVTSRKLRYYFKLQLPLALTLLLSLLGFVNFGFSVGPSVKPLTTLMCLFYWACYWPRMLHPVGIFAIGLVEDVIANVPLGFSPVLYLVAYIFVLSQRRLIVKEPFPVAWGVFALVALGYVAGAFIVFGLLLGQPWPGYTPLIQWAVTAACYPFIHQFCLLLQEYLVQTTRVATGRKFGS